MPASNKANINPDDILSSISFSPDSWLFNQQIVFSEENSPCSVCFAWKKEEIEQEALSLQYKSEPRNIKLSLWQKVYL
jgi:hypothetical protein